MRRGLLSVAMGLTLTALTALAAPAHADPRTADPRTANSNIATSTANSNATTRTATSNIATTDVATRTADSAAVHVVLATLSSPTVPDGGRVELRSRGFVPGSVVRLSVDGVPGESAVADARGAVATAVTLHGPGAHSVAVTGPGATGGLRVASDPVQVLDTAPAAPSRSAPLSLLAGLAVVAVAAAGTYGRRRRGPSPFPLLAQ